jgi:hypothetical protein
MSTPTHGAPASPGAAGMRDGGPVKAPIVEAGPWTVLDLGDRLVAAVPPRRRRPGVRGLGAVTASPAGPVVAPMFVTCRVAARRGERWRGRPGLRLAVVAAFSALYITGCAPGRAQNCGFVAATPVIACGYGGTTLALPGWTPSGAVSAPFWTAFLTCSSHFRHSGRDSEFWLRFRHFLMLQRDQLAKPRPEVRICYEFVMK